MIETELRTVVEASCRRETVAFRQLYDRLQSRVFAYVAYRTPTREVAVDLTQDIFVELYQALPSCTYRSDAEFYSFVFTIVRRMVAKYYADKHTQATKDQVAIPEEILSDDTVQESERMAVRQALDQLDEIAREIVVLHHWSRYTFGEIAIMLTMSESAVRTRHHRALATLNPLLTTTPSV
jgi:RNA polymerase sigma-70 factor, ECF subfamily